MFLPAVKMMLRLVTVAVALAGAVAEVTDGNLVRRQQKEVMQVQLLPDGSSETALGLVDGTISSDEKAEVRASTKASLKQFSVCLGFSV